METRRKFDAAYKLMAVELVSLGNSVQKVSTDLGIRVDYVRKWVREHKSGKEGVFPGNGNPILTDSEKRIRALEKELRESKMENEILKKAVGIFSKRD